MDLNGDLYDLNNAMRMIMLNCNEYKSVAQLRSTITHLTHIYEIRKEQGIEEWLENKEEKDKTLFRALIRKEEV